MNRQFQTTLIFTLTFAISFAGLYAFGLVPSEIKGYSPVSQVSDVSLKSTQNANNESSGVWVTSIDKSAEPIQIIIPKILVDSKIENPNSTDVKILDKALLTGAVHYPGSGSLKDTSNVFIFGHSTSHVVVKNNSYKTFNRLNELNIGDEIRVLSNTAEYIYAVKSVAKAQASESLVTFSNSKRMLTLSTCNSFGEKSERFVVEAEFVRSVEF